MSDSEVQAVVSSLSILALRLLYLSRSLYAWTRAWSMKGVPSSIFGSQNPASMRQVGSVLWPRLRAVQVYGANTGVGKTVVSTLLCKALRKRLPDFNVHYLKPISTGPLDEADNR